MSNPIWTSEKVFKEPICLLQRKNIELAKIITSLTKEGNSCRPVLCLWTGKDGTTKIMGQITLRIHSMNKHDPITCPVYAQTKWQPLKSILLPFESVVMWYLCWACVMVIKECDSPWRPPSHYTWRLPLTITQAPELPLNSFLNIKSWIYILTEIEISVKKT